MTIQKFYDMEEILVKYEKRSETDSEEDKQEYILMMKFLTLS